MDVVPCFLVMCNEYQQDFFITVKEQCIVLFPYNAVNEDELTLEEGSIVNVVSKDVEDKGWWKGEVDGRQGVFPVSLEFKKKINKTLSLSHYVQLSQFY